MARKIKEIDYRIRWGQFEDHITWIKGSYNQALGQKDNYTLRLKKEASHALIIWFHKGKEDHAFMDWFRN